MKLTDLEPRWLDEHVFVFRCPHCRSILLSCKDAPMATRDQYRLFARELGEDWNRRVVGTKQDVAWRISSKDFESMSVTPSIDASASGHWHGHITDGEIR